MVLTTKDTSTHYIDDFMFTSDSLISRVKKYRSACTLFDINRISLYKVHRFHVTKNFLPKYTLLDINNNFTFQGLVKYTSAAMLSKAQVLHIPKCSFLEINDNFTFQGLVEYPSAPCSEHLPKCAFLDINDNFISGE